MIKNITLTLSPSRIILFSFFLLIIIGTLLLSLPISHIYPIPLIDLFFTATSATCVTGLFTIPLNTFTLFGKTVILLLIQIGALGLASMSLLIISLFMDLGISTKFMAGQLLELDSWQNIKKILKFTFISTIVLEIIGALCFFTIFFADYTFYNALFYSFFHSISSFCNAGISFLHFLTQQNLGKYSENYLFLAMTTFLTFFGSLGFITWHEIMMRIHAYKYAEKPRRLSLHSKIILYTTLSLLSITAALFFILEYNNALAMLSLPLALANSLFHAVSFKSCGFILTNLTDFHIATIFVIMIVGLIGSSPGSTGSGIKTTTIALFLSIVKSTIKERPAIEAFEREIPNDQVFKAVTIIALSIGWIIFTTFCLLITETDWGFMELFFETVSGFSNVGFSLKGSHHLSCAGKLLICITMFIGRIGSLTFILGLKFKTRTDGAEFTYPEERIMLG